MTKSLAVGTAVVVVLAGLQYGYIVLRAPTQVETLVPPARPPIGLIGFDEPLPQPTDAKLPTKTIKKPRRYEER